MNTHADRTRDKRLRSMSRRISQNQRSGGPTYRIEDNRLGTITQRTLQEIGFQRPRASQLSAFQDGLLQSSSPAASLSVPATQLKVDMFSTNVLQRAGDYTGLMLPHERQAGPASYALGGRERLRTGEHKLTYHHIIPEGKLVRLGKMVMRFEALYGEKNAHTDKLERLKRELTAIQEEVTGLRRAIAKGEEAARKITGMEIRQDPRAAEKARDRGWDDAVRAGDAAEEAMGDATRRLAEKEGEIEELTAALTLSPQEEALLGERAAGVPETLDRPERRGTGDRTRGDFLRAEIQKLVASTRLQAQAVKDDTEAQMRASASPIVRGRADGFHDQDIRESFSDEYESSLGFGGVAWIPGNIHEGPSDRISRGGGDPDFDENRDDGGSEFEPSARHLIPDAQFALLEQLSQNLNLFEEREDTAFDANRIDQFVDLLHRINEIRETYPNIKQFDVTEWEQVQTGVGGRQTAGTVEPANRVAGAGHTKAGIIPRPAVQPPVQAPVIPPVQPVVPVDNGEGSLLGSFFRGIGRAIAAVFQ